MSENNIIHVLNKRVALHQAPEGFRTSTDSVLLAAACPARSGEAVLDLGCGVGSAGICVLSRVEGTSLMGVDIQACHVELAEKNAAENGFTGRARFSCGDVRETLDLPLSYDHVVCNPPYKEAGAHRPSPSASKAAAMGHQDDDLTLQSWITCAWEHIKGQGSLTMIHEAGKLDEILHSLYSPKGGRRFGQVEVFPIFSKDGQAANRVIVRSWKHKKAGSVIHTGIVIHESDGSYTNEAENVLRHSAPLIR